MVIWKTEVVEYVDDDGNLKTFIAVPESHIAIPYQKFSEITGIEISNYDYPDICLWLCRSALDDIEYVVGDVLAMVVDPSDRYTPLKCKRSVKDQEDTEGYEKFRFIHSFNSKFYAKSISQEELDARTKPGAEQNLPFCGHENITVFKIPLIKWELLVYFSNWRFWDIRHYFSDTVIEKRERIRRVKNMTAKQPQPLNLTDEAAIEAYEKEQSQENAKEKN